MPQFVELEDGSVINLDHVVKLTSNRLNRLEFITGAHIQLSAADGEKIRKRLTGVVRSYIPPNGSTTEASVTPKPKKRRGRPPKAKPSSAEDQNRSSPNHHH